MKQRKVRRPTRFESRWARGRGNRRDYLVSTYMMVVVQALLVVFLLWGAFRGFTAMGDRMQELGWHFRYGIPLVMVTIALIVLKLLIDNVKQVVETHREPPPRV
jgi:hypothetical protein